MNMYIKMVVIGIKTNQVIEKLKQIKKLQKQHRKARHFRYIKKMKCV